MTGVAYTLDPIHPDPDSPEVWVITGASRGLGAEFVKQLLERGAHVAAGARDPGSSPPLQELTRRFPQELLLLTLDVASEESIKAAAAEVNKRFPGGIQFLVNSAGHGGAVGNVFEVTPQMFKECLSCNVLGPHLMYQSFVPLMTKSAGQGDSVFSVPHTNADDAKPSTTAGGESGDRGDAQPSAADGTPNGHAAPANGHAPEPNGHPAGRRLRRAVINLGSNMGSSEENRARLHTKQSVVPMYCLDYRASKAALACTTTVYAATLRKFQIFVVCIHPGWVATDMGNAAAAGVSHALGKEVKPPLTPPESVGSMLQFIDRLEEEHTGGFFFHDGRPHIY